MGSAFADWVPIYRQGRSLTTGLSLYTNSTLPAIRQAQAVPHHALDAGLKWISLLPHTPTAYHDVRDS